MSEIKQVLKQILVDVPNVHWESDSSYTPIIPTSRTQIAGLIDHTYLKATATTVDIKRVCQEAVENGFATVCVNTRWIQLVQECLNESTVKPIAVVGFPLGAQATDVKVLEAEWAVQNGAKEVDMVIAIGDLIEGNYERVFSDIQSVVQSAKCPVKVILETCYLSRDEIIAGSLLSKAAGAAFVKTSTGFASAGAKESDVELIRSVVGNSVGVKASGGIKSIADLLTMVRAGATRIGASSGVQILQGSFVDDSY